MTTVYAVADPYGPTTYHDTEREAQRHAAGIDTRHPGEHVPVYAVEIHDEEMA